MYNKFFGFKEKPFKLVPNPEYLFLSKSHEEVLAHLTYAISQGEGFVEITGEVGTGKTTLCRVFLENLDATVNAAYIFNPKLDALQLLKAINDEFGIDSAPDNTKDLIDRLNAFLIEKKGAGQKVMVLIDEAQNLSLEVLEQLRLLSNLETTQEKLLQIILVGQPELGDLLSSHQLRQLGQRITINCRLSPLTYEETRDYIRHRITLASYRAGPAFDKASYRAIYEYSRGIPRLVNIACDRALLNAFSRNSFNVTGAIAEEAIRELTRKKTPNRHNWLHSRAAAVILSAVFIPLLLLLLYVAMGKAPEIPGVSKLFFPEQATLVEKGPAVSDDAQVGVVTLLPEESITPEAEAPITMQERPFASDQAAEAGNNAEPLILPGNKWTEEPLAAETTIAAPQDLGLEDTQKFLNYLQTLNSRLSRNNSLEKLLRLWFPAAEITINQDKIQTERLFFQEEAGHYGLQAQPLATESDLTIIESLNLPAIFTFYLPGYAWPKYLAVVYIDAEKIYFATTDPGQIISVDRDIFLQHWSGEAYIFWRNFKNIKGVFSQWSSDHDAKALKELLQQLGYNNIAMTDSYDNDTVQIIKAIQAKYNLYIDGVVGPFTKIALYNESRAFIKPSLVAFEAAGRENSN